MATYLAETCSLLNINYNVLLLLYLCAFLGTGIVHIRIRHGSCIKWRIVFTNQCDPNLKHNSD